MNTLLKNKLTLGFFLLGFLTIIFTIVEKLLFPQFTSGAMAFGSVAAQVVKANNNYQFYLPLGLLLMFFGWLYHTANPGKRFFLNKIPGYLHLIGNSLYVFLFMYGFLIYRLQDQVTKSEIKDSYWFGLIFSISILGLLIGTLIFIINLIVGFIRFLTPPKRA